MVVSVSSASAEAPVEEIAPGVHRIALPLPDDGLHAVNVYALEHDGRVTLVDAGWSYGPAFEMLENALESISLDPGCIDRVLVTHMHRDHYTLGMRLRRRYGTRVLLGRGEQDSLEAVMRGSGDGTSELLGLWGATELAPELDAEPPQPDSIFELPDAWLEAPREIAVGDRTLRAIPTPGHTRGHLVFADLDAGLLFSGDHVLPTITPSIGYEPVRSPLPLADYIGSLHLMLELPDLVLLPAHGAPGGRTHPRVNELLDFHIERLEETSDVVSQGGSLTAMQVARSLSWTRRRRGFDELDARNRLFAVAETAAHLDVLARDGAVTVEPGVERRYRASVSASPSPPTVK